MTLVVTPLPQSLGATVTGLDLRAGLNDETVERLLRAWHDNLVLFFPELHLDDDQHIALGSVFGDLAATTQGNDDQRDHLNRGPRGEILVLDADRPQDRANAWHTDVTFTANPPIGSLLSMQVCPDKGGDTLWTNQIAAYEALSPAVRTLIDELSAVHGRPGLTGSTTHPMVAIHPTTGRKALFVNRGWTTAVDGLSQIESRHLLAMLFEHAEKPEFQVRWTWKAGDAALWDNRVTMHYAVDDYGSAARILHRVTIYASPTSVPHPS
ncbi:MAG TPA: TauD/TfdA family dioxygenase [Ilumatobacteraceae bacterium]|nr:TauD/TfdA family dioxygenase [Ilumatobacteraceae bacterium]